MAAAHCFLRLFLPTGPLHKSNRLRRLPPLLRRSLCFCFFVVLQILPYLSPFLKCALILGFFGLRRRIPHRLATGQTAMLAIQPWRSF